MERPSRESEHVEFKRSSGEAKNAMRSVAAMLNKHGEATIYFGLDNDGNPVKNIIKDSSLRDISRIIFESIEPRVTPRIDTVDIEGVEVIKVFISGTNQPYSANGVYYIRSADEDRVMSQRELLSLFQEKNYAEEWEKQMTSFGLEDIDEEALRSFYDASRRANRLEQKDYEAESLLATLGMLRDGHLNNAGYYLFGKKAPAELKMAVYATESKIAFIDLKNIRGNIFNLVNEGLYYVKAHIDWRVRILAREREEIPEIPEEAIREIIVNSFAHARYGDGFLNEINIYPDAIEIVNPGTFPERYSPRDFVEQRIGSMQRNPLLLDALFRSKDVEKSGSGFSRVNDLCLQEGVKWGFERLPNGFKFIFYRKKMNQKRRDAMAYRIPNDSVALRVKDESFYKDKALIISLMEKNPFIKTEEIAAKLDLSKRTIQRMIKELSSEGKLTRVGTKKGYWKILD